MRVIQDSPPASSRKARLKRTTAFRAVYRQGRWAKGRTLSVGVLPNHLRISRVGLRTRKGLKGAVVRNRIKRQLRAIVDGAAFSLREGLDVVIVAHPKPGPVEAAKLEQELRNLCREIEGLG